MTLTKIAEYRGFFIHYNNNDKKFILTAKDSNEELRSAPTQDELEKMADSLIASRKKLNPPIPAIVSDWGKYAFAKLTSYDPEHQEVWATTGEGDRGKHSIQYVYHDNESNRKLLVQINQNQQEMKHLDNQNKALREQLQPFSQDDFA